MSYALEQPEMLRSHDYKHNNVMHNFSVRPLYMYIAITILVMVAVDRYINIHQAMRWEKYKYSFSDPSTDPFLWFIYHLFQNNFALILFFQRYNIIMKTSKGWWMISFAWIFSLCVGSLVFTVTDLKQNHECSYEFSIARVHVLK